MTKKEAISKMDIILFKVTDHLQRRCQLKNFLHFLHSYGIKRPIRFAYVEGNAPLLNNLTLRENIYLDSLPHSLTQSKDFQLKSHLEKMGNEYLLKLFHKIGSLDCYPTEVDQQTRKIAALIKALMQNPDYLLLEKPEHDLDQEHLLLFVKAMEFQTIGQGLVVLISSPQEKFWQQHISKTVTRGPKQEFLVDSNAFDKKSTNSNDTEKKLGHLRFVNLDDKKAA